MNIYIVCMGAHVSHVMFLDSCTNVYNVDNSLWCWLYRFYTIVYKR